MRRALILIVAFVVVAAIALQVWLPQRAARAIRDALAHSGTQVQHTKVTVSSFPAWEMLTGRVDRLHVELVGITADPPIKEATLDAMGLSYNAAELLAGKPLVIHSVEQGQGEVTITEADMNTYLAKAAGTTGFATVALDGTKATLKGDTEVAGLRVTVQMVGSFKPSSQGIAFVPDHIRVIRPALPEGLVIGLSSSLTIEIPLPQLPVPMVVSAVTGERGALHVHLQATPTAGG